MLSSDLLAAVGTDTPIDSESAGGGRRCPQWAIRKPAGGRCPRGISRRASTRACEGPDRRAWTNWSTRFAGPATRTSTLPSGRFRTVPRRPSVAAVLRAHQRNPTPWTRPTRTKARRLSLRCVRMASPWILCSGSSGRRYADHRREARKAAGERGWRHSRRHEPTGRRVGVECGRMT